jgi:hypothetical protein
MTLPTYEQPSYADLLARNAKLREELFRSNEEACGLAVALSKLRRLVAVYVKDAPALQEADAVLAKFEGEPA